MCSFIKGLVGTKIELLPSTNISPCPTESLPFWAHKKHCKFGVYV